MKITPARTERLLALLGTIGIVVLSVSWASCGGGDTSSGGGGSFPTGSTGSKSAAGGSTSSTTNNGGGGSGGIDFTTTGSGGKGQGGSSDDCSGKLPVTLRDFTPTTDPDFENPNQGDDHGIVKDDLGADNKPVYNGMPTTPTTHGKATFDVWYNTTANVNMEFPFEITLTKGANGIYTYDNQAYFPLDGMGFGNYGDSGHNFHFTSEVHTHFEYKGGEVFTFTGDDDLWTFINKKLAINLGGIHGAETASVNLDDVAADLGIAKGGTYQLDVFGAERHTTESHFRIDTTIGCFKPPPK